MFRKMLFALTFVFILPSTATAQTGPTAILNGKTIPISQVASLHCNDRSYPIIRCFDTEAGVKADITAAVKSMAVQPMNYSYPYVAIYSATNYGGSSLWLWHPYPDLRTIGWNDRIQSALEIDAIGVQYFRDINWGLLVWQDGDGDVMIPTFGYWNKQISSIRPCHMSGSTCVPN